MTNLEALKELYVNMGGDEDLTGATTLVEVLNAIAVLGGGEGASTLNADAIAEIANGDIGGGKLTNKVLIKQTTFVGRLTAMFLTENGTYHVQDLGSEAVECYLPANDGDTPIMGVAMVIYSATSLQDLQLQDDAEDADVMLILEPTTNGTAAVYVEAETSGFEIDLTLGGINI